MRLINGICMESHREVKHYSGNTTNMRVHLMHHVHEMQPEDSKANIKSAQPKKNNQP